jgi:PKD repeat protein
MHRVSLFKLIPIGAIALSASCTLTDQKAPPLAGPSEFSLAMVLTATPDLIAANGASQSVINVTTHDAFGQPRPNVQLRVDTVDGSGLIVEQGTLSARTITTGSNGQASLTYTAPMESAFNVDSNGSITVRVLPISTDFGSETSRYVTIRLVPPTTVVIPGAPIPDFFFSPAAPRPGGVVSFNASRSFDSDGYIVSYKWEWGDSDPPITRSNALEDHDYVGAGTYNVTLTVTDNAGQQSSITKRIIVQ